MTSQPAQSGFLLPLRLFCQKCSKSQSRPKMSQYKAFLLLLVKNMVANLYGLCHFGRPRRIYARGVVIRRAAGNVFELSRDNLPRDVQRARGRQILNR